MTDKLNTYLQSSRLYPVLVLDSLISKQKLDWLINVTGTLILFLALPILSFQIFRELLSPSIFEVWSLLVPRFWGGILICSAFYFLIKALTFYFNDSYYFDNVALNKYADEDLYTITVGRILFQADKGDALRGFLKSQTGQEILWRLGVNRKEQKKFLEEHQVTNELPKQPLNGVLKMRALSQFLYNQNPDFVLFLKKHGVSEKDFLGATDWVVRQIEARVFLKRWWSKENLKRVPGLAKDWGFGSTFTLDKYGWDMLRGARYSSPEHEYTLFSTEISQLENILAKEREANAILVGDTREEALDIVWHLTRKIQNRTTLSALEFKRLVLINASVFLSHFKERQGVEKELLKIFNEARSAGNVILVIDDLYNLMVGFQNLGSSFLGLADEYLLKGSFQIIAVTTTDVYHRLLVGNSGLMNAFDRIFVKAMSSESLIFALQESVWQVEHKHKLFFTYQSLLEIIMSADSYFSESSSSDKSMDLVAEMVSWAKSRELKIIRRRDVLNFISDKTKVPLGEIGAEERVKLQNLEVEIHKRVIGQNEAVKSVSGALRRSRAGVRNPNRPIGSFLFLGPTGVGKTETAKALAEVTFGQEASLLRLDMSEFQDEHAISKLTGSFETGKTGILTDMLRERSYGVLLLDEFEKTNREAQNLFLQILDEGFFSDMNGKRINARNIIFIATSNAGAEFIWENFRLNKKEENTSDNLINHIVSKGIFRPELLNRFDATVIFEPLSAKDLKDIAGLMLKKLAKRLSGQGLDLEISEYLTESVAILGANEVFGARPMQRFIQDNIEQKVAEALIDGTLTQGDKVIFEEPNLKLKNG